MFEHILQFLFYGGTITQHKTQITFFIWMHNHRTKRIIFSIEGHITICILCKHNHRPQDTISFYRRTYHNFYSIQAQSQNTRNNFFYGRTYHIFLWKHNNKSKIKEDETPTCNRMRQRIRCHLENVKQHTLPLIKF
jgi:hypothetical protein